jgi:F0F1-type ATP synthase epsilon subunit
MNDFNLKIVSFDKIVVDESVTYCAVYTPKGKIGFKAHHEAFVSTLREKSAVEYTLASGESKSVDIDNGLFSFKDNNATLLAGFDDKKKV